MADQNVQIDGFTITDPLVVNPIQITGAQYKGGLLIMTLSQSVNDAWEKEMIDCCLFPHRIKAEALTFSSNTVTAAISPQIAVEIARCFKAFIPSANAKYRDTVVTGLKAEKKSNEDLAKCVAAEQNLEESVNAELQKLF